MKLWQQVILGLILGAGLGVLMGEDAASFKVLGVIFISLIKMIIAPLVFFALVFGITSLDSDETVSRIGIKAIIMFFFTASVAVFLGFGIGHIFEPGAGLGLDLNPNPAGTPTGSNLGDIFMGIVPTNAMQAMVEANILQVVIFAIFTGMVLNLMGKEVKTVRTFCHEAANITFKMVELIVRLAPIGVFGYIAWTVGTQGVDVIYSLGKLVLAVTVGCVLHYLFLGSFISLVGRISPLPFYRKMFEPQLLAFSTSSSSAALSTNMRVLNQDIGVSKTSTNFVLPLGATINMDGTALYLAITALFIAQATGIELTQANYLTLFLTSTLASIGAASIPGGGLIFMGMVFGSIGLPIEGLALIAGVDRILDMMRTAINITGDAAIALVVDKTEGSLNTKTYNA